MIINVSKHHVFLTSHYVIQFMITNVSMITDVSMIRALLHSVCWYLGTASESNSL
jgi:hypothetical protein